MKLMFDMTTYVIEIVFPLTQAAEDFSVEVKISNLQSRQSELALYRSVATVGTSQDFLLTVVYSSTGWSNSA